jgi:hypothetical protein
MPDAKPISQIVMQDYKAQRMSVFVARISRPGIEKRVSLRA